MNGGGGGPKVPGDGELSFPTRAPNCLKCRFFAVSWDPSFPRSCSVFGVKSRDMPSMLVYQSTGRHCPAFQESPRLRKNN